MKTFQHFNRSSSDCCENSETLCSGQHYDFVVLNFGNHVEFAAHAVEQWKRVKEEFGFVSAYLGYSPDSVITSPWDGSEEEYSQSYYWKTYLDIPFFSETVGASKWTRLKTLLKANCTTAISLCRATIFAATRGNNGFFQSIRCQRVRGLSIGPAVLSDYLRRDYLRGYSGYLKLDREFVKIMYVCHRYLHYWLDVCPQQNFSRVLFSCPETTYRDEIARQALLSRGAKEIFMQRWSESKFAVWSTHREGWELNVAYPDALHVKPDDVAKAREQMAMRLSGNLNYVYMSTDVSNKPVMDQNSRNQTGRPQAVIYLHLVSDAQHANGPDCFNDLHHWLRASIKMLSQLGFRIFLKLHPLNVSPRLPGDTHYKAYLENWLGVGWDRLTFGQVLPSRHAEVYLVDYRVPIKAMCELLGSFLCVTHHGVIATEATAAGVPAVISSAGPYRYFPRFAYIYDSISQYEELLKRYAQGQMKVTPEMESNLYYYLASTKGDFNKWLWIAFGEMSGRPYFSDPELTYRFFRQISNDDDVPEPLRVGFGGTRPVINIDGVDRVRCDAVGSPAFPPIAPSFPPE